MKKQWVKNIDGSESIVDWDGFKNPKKAKQEILDKTIENCSHCNKPIHDGDWRSQDSLGAVCCDDCKKIKEKSFNLEWNKKLNDPNYWFNHVFLRWEYNPNGHPNSYANKHECFGCHKKVNRIKESYGYYDKEFYCGICHKELEDLNKI